jgi:hypothetical protein
VSSAATTFMGVMRAISSIVRYAAAAAPDGKTS